jgi:hypothetical protein
MAMKVKQAVEAALRSAGREDGAEIIRQQAKLDLELNALIDEESESHFIAHLIEEFLANGYSLERPDELIEALAGRPKSGPPA